MLLSSKAEGTDNPGSANHPVMGQTAGLLALGVAIALGTPAATARACGNPDNDNTPGYVAGGSVTPDGVLIAGVEGELDAEQTELTVVVGGKPVAGTSEYVELVNYGYSGLLVFHPDEPLVLGASYKLAVDSQDVGTIEVVQGDVSEVGIPLESSSLRTILAHGIGRRACCHLDTSGPASECNMGLTEKPTAAAAETTVEACAGTEMGDQVWLQTTVDRDPLEARPATFASVYFEVFSGVDGVADTLTGRGQLRDLDAMLSVVLEDQAGSYCIRLDVINVADGTRETDTLCEHDPGLDLQRGPDDYTSSTLPGACLDALYWEDTGEPVQAAEVPHYDGPLEENSGCSCSTSGPPGATALLALGLLGLRRRRCLPRITPRITPRHSSDQPQPVGS